MGGLSVVEKFSFKTFDELGLLFWLKAEERKLLINGGKNANICFVHSFSMLIY